MPAALVYEGGERFPRLFFRRVLQPVKDVTQQVEHAASCAADRRLARQPLDTEVGLVVQRLATADTKIDVELGCVRHKHAMAEAAGRISSWPRRLLDSEDVDGGVNTLGK